MLHQVFSDDPNALLMGGELRLKEDRSGVIDPWRIELKVCLVADDELDFVGSAPECRDDRPLGTDMLFW